MLECDAMKPGELHISTGTDTSSSGEINVICFK